MLNQLAHRLFTHAWNQANSHGVRCQHVADCQILDAGCDHRGSLAGGHLLARLCLADAADVRLVPRSGAAIGTDWDVVVTTDSPLKACLGSQYAGWPVSVNDFFAMASGPMRMLRGREQTLIHLELREESDVALGVLESERLPTAEVVEAIAEQCGLATSQLAIAIAPSTSIAGSLQVVARSVETAMHKLHELKFDVKSIVSAAGVAPLPPPAKTGNIVGGIGRTNDAILYGGRVTFWVDTEDDAIESVIKTVPSQSSSDHGRPFAEIFKDYGYDFYKVDPMLFSPAVVTMHNLRSGRTWQQGEEAAHVLQQSFVS